MKILVRPNTPAHLTLTLRPTPQPNVAPSARKNTTSLQPALLPSAHPPPPTTITMSMRLAKSLSGALLPAPQFSIPTHTD